MEGQGEPLATVAANTSGQRMDKYGSAYYGNWQERTKAPRNLSQRHIHRPGIAPKLPIRRAMAQHNIPCRTWIYTECPRSDRTPEFIYFLHYVCIFGLWHNFMWFRDPVRQWTRGKAAPSQHLRSHFVIISWMSCKVSVADTSNYPNDKLLVATLDCTKRRLTGRKMNKVKAAFLPVGNNRRQSGRASLQNQHYFMSRH